MRVLGIDPGVTLGWCVVDANVDSATWVAAGTKRVEGNELLVATELWKLAEQHNIAVVAIEDYARRFVSPAAAQQMIQSAQSCGIITGTLWALRVVAGSWLKLEIKQCPAHEWRKAIAGNGQAKDAKIAWALNELVKVQNMPARTNAHVRDACGLAVYAAQRADGG